MPVSVSDLTCIVDPRNGSPQSRGRPASRRTADATSLGDDEVSQLQDVGVKASGETRAGLPGEAAKAIDEASSFGADLIMMGSRWLSDFQALSVGSAAHRVRR